MVEELSKIMKESASGVIVNYTGVTVEDDTALRKELRTAKVSYSVKKNSIISRAADAAGLSGMDEFLKGATAIAISAEDLVAPAKILSKFAKDHDSFKIKAGFIEGKVVSEQEVKTLASLPPKEVLIAQVLSGFNAPIAGFANVLNANLRGLVVALNAIAEQKKDAA